jgi:hypothetical protein
MVQAEGKVPTTTCRNSSPLPAAAETGTAGLTAQQQQQQLQWRQQLHGGRERQQQRPDMLVLDLPWLYHWPKLLCWLAFEACHVVLATLEGQERIGQSQA